MGADEGTPVSVAAAVNGTVRSLRSLSFFRTFVCFMSFNNRRHSACASKRCVSLLGDKMLADLLLRQAYYCAYQ
ncbi:hypothetical protein MKW98_024585 [Papaver atlanticum]|uniref:Uncharacterized protein n=1 Tax=Papaver atlanticum TaxID=357466 RepID=A0AAD4S777_9MAGN|nr:hypothetical protein MKW98_024585 [Papaver atlanticum]